MIGIFFCSNKISNKFWVYLFYRNCRHTLLRNGDDKFEKSIGVIIKPFKLDDVRKALTEIGVEGLTASEVRGFGRQRGQTEIYRGTEYSVSFVPKLKIELAVPDELEEKVLETLNKSANTGQIGDGKIFVFDIKSATRIRTGETGNDALS